MEKSSKLISSIMLSFEGKIMLSGVLASYQTTTISIFM